MDGREARSQRTRAAVAEAMLDCLQEGILRPSSKQVAERAGVSSRAVFRHFEDMETLFEVASQIQGERVLSQLPSLVMEGGLRERIDGFVRRMSRRNEIITPVRRAALLSEPFSTGMRARRAAVRKAYRQQLRQVFAPELARLGEGERRERIAALQALFSFGYWEALRHHSQLSKTAASRALTTAVEAVLVHVPAAPH